MAGTPDKSALQVASTLDSIDKDLETTCLKVGTESFTAGGYSVSKDMGLSDIMKVGQITNNATQKAEAIRVAPKAKDQIKNKMTSQVLQQ